MILWHKPKFASFLLQKPFLILHTHTLSKEGRCSPWWSSQLSCESPSCLLIDLEVYHSWTRDALGGATLMQSEISRVASMVWSLQPEFWTPKSVLETDLLILHEQHLSSKATTHHFKITYFRKTSFHKCICFDFFWRAQVDFLPSFRLQDFGHRSLPIFCSTSPVTATSYIPSPGSAGWSWNALGRTEKDVPIEILGSPKNS